VSIDGNHQLERLLAELSTRFTGLPVEQSEAEIERAMADGGSRKDLYFGLSAFPIPVPSLPDRREISRFPSGPTFIERTPNRAMEALMAYAWPGSVRELENVIERALVLSTGSTLRVAETLGAGDGAGQQATERLDDVERAHIRRVLDGCRWKVGGKGHAAETLGLHPDTLPSRLRKLGIRQPAAPPHLRRSGAPGGESRSW
jgi:transcriptional regulator of acetoin/glycerol metabolism